MKRPATLILFALSIIAGGTLFGVAFEVSALEDRLIVLNEEITRDRDSIHVLRAEWSYLNQPDRLEGLSRRYLDLQPIKGEQFSDIAALPVRPLPDILPAAVTTEEADPAEPEPPIASTPTAKPRLKPAAPRRPSRHVRLASQPAKATPGMNAPDNAALNASLRAIFGDSR
jgi:hypothetical protein